MSETQYKQGDLVLLSGNEKGLLIRRGYSQKTWLVVRNPDDINQGACAVRVDDDEIKGPYREPLKVEFECEWREFDGRHNNKITAPASVETEIYQFIGKRTKVTIIEVID